MEKEMLKAILESIDEAIHVVDERGVTIYYNTVASQHDGLSIEEVLGKHVLDVFPSLSEQSSTLLKVIKTKKPILNCPQSYRNLKGQQIETINTTLPIMVDGAAAGAVEIGKDYSKIKKLNDKLLDLQSLRNVPPSKPQKRSGAIYTFDDILTQDKSLMNLKAMAAKCAKVSSSVLVYGETGTGKELLVQSIHNASPRKNGPFIAQNCAALPETLLESLLFGTAKGSYTGAVDRAGLFELADGGTLFLDELHAMPIELQAKLLRVLEDGMVRRIGDSKTRPVNVRIIAAMNQHPADCLQKQMLREDLYYRLNVFPLELPPLRKRKGDLYLLAHHFIELLNPSFGGKINAIDSSVISLMQAYNWPGNIRELKHLIEQALILCEGECLDINCFPALSALEATDESSDAAITPLREALSIAEKSLIEKALHATGRNINQAAKLLDIPRQTLQYKLQKLDL